MAYSKTDRAKAIKLYFDQGGTVAAQTIGCSRETVYVWVAEESDTSEKEEARAERLAMKRKAMAELFHDKALELAAAVDTSDPATARFMLAACQAVDKALFLSTGSSKGVPPVITIEILEAEIRRLEEMGIRPTFPKSPGEAELDAELRKALDEMDRKTREADDIIRGQKYPRTVPPWETAQRIDGNGNGPTGAA